jgi:tricorn protease
MIHNFFLATTLAWFAGGTGLPALHAQQDAAGTRMMSQPAVSAEHIAFSYDRDLWIAHRDGSNPRRLTSHEGTEVSPRFSPDGKWLAFTGEYDGNTDVYLVSVDGGVPQRLTWHPAADLVEGFTPDGSAVLFSSNRNVFTRRYSRLYTVSVNGGFPDELPIPNGLRGSFSPDGKKILHPDCRAFPAMEKLPGRHLLPHLDLRRGRSFGRDGAPAGGAVQRYRPGVHW